VPVLTSVLLRVDQDIGPVSGIVAIQDYILRDQGQGF
jgi:hypothetical protein